MQFSPTKCYDIRILLASSQTRYRYSLCRCTLKSISFRSHLGIHHQECPWRSSHVNHATSDVMVLRVIRQSQHKPRMPLFVDRSSSMESSPQGYYLKNQTEFRV